MKRLLWVLLLSCGMFGQTFTPNLALQLPPRGAVNWDSVINHNFSTLDLTIGRLQNPFLGAWSSSVVYFKAQQVTSGGLLYISLNDFNLANTPASSPTSWINVAITGVSTPHAFLSATHTDTVAAAPVRGDGIFAIGATPTWQRLAHSAATGGYWKWNGTDVVSSTNAAAGTGSCAGGQFVSATNADAAPTCSQSGTGTTNTLSKFTNGAAGIHGDSSITDNGTTVSTAENFLFGDGTKALPAITFSGNTGSGFSRVTTNIVMSANGTAQHLWGQGLTRIGATNILGWSGNSDPVLATSDVNITRSAPGIIQVGTGETANSAGEFDARTLGVTGATSGKATLTTDATATKLIASVPVSATTGYQIGGVASANTFLKGNGTNYVSGSPTLASADFANQGTTTTVLHGNVAGNPAFGAIVLTTDVSGVLPQANGGTGQNSTAVFPTSGNIVSEAATETLTNKRVTQRVVTLTTSTTFTPDGDNSDLTQMNMTGVAGTLTIAAPTGTPTDAQKLILRVKTTNAQTYSFNATYRFSTTTVAPTTTGAAKTDLIGLIWNATDTKWDVVAVDQGH